MRRPYLSDSCAAVAPRKWIISSGTLLDRLITERPDSWLPEGYASHESLLPACYREALESLTKRLGPERAAWTWGRLGSTRFPHPLEKLGPAGSVFGVPPLPQSTGGSMPAVNACDRVSMRLVADLNDWDYTLLCIPLGESGEPSSPHRADQLADWLNVTPPALPFAREAIEAAARDVLELSPPTGVASQDSL